MHEVDLIELFIRPLNQSQFRYVVSGSVAAMLYGEPRVTHDIDLLIFLQPHEVARISEVFPQPQFYVPPVEMILGELARAKGQFNIVHVASGLKADIFTISRDEFHVWAFRNFQQYTLGDLIVRLAPPEYVIVRKLEYFREGGSDKHLRDIRGMLNVSGEQIDRDVLNEWIQRQKVESEWQKVSA